MYDGRKRGDTKAKRKDPLDRVFRFKEGDF